MPITLTQENTLIVRGINLDNEREQKVNLKVFIVIPSTVVKGQTLKKLLTEGVDYRLEGDVTAERPGFYSVVIQGINKYDGRTVAEWEVLARNDPRITKNQYRNQILGDDPETEEYEESPLIDDDDDLPYTFSIEPKVSCYEEIMGDQSPEGHTPRRPKLTIIYDVFHLPCSWHAYQDSCIPAESFVRETEYGAGFFRIAVADGLTSSYHCKEYADILTSTFVEGGKDWFDMEGWDLLSADWKIKQEEAIQEAYPDSPEQQKFEEKMLEHSSASATLNAVEFSLNSTLYRVWCLGDTVFFDIENGETPEISAQCPEMKLEDFTDHPKLLSTAKEYDSADLRKGLGLFSTDHVYLIGTKALAKLIVQETQESRQRDTLRALVNMPDNESFMNFCLDQRIAGQLEDDDTTMVRIRFVQEKP